MFTRIKLTNFRKHEALELDFTEGLNVLRGANFQGKSTVFMALTFALFGSKAVPGGKALIPTHGRKDCEVELGLTVDGRDLTITRTLNNATVAAGNDAIATGHAPVTEYVENLLGMDLKRFKRLLYAEQSETGALLTMGATELQKDIESMSGLDLVDRVIKAVKTDATKLQGKLEGRQTVDLDPLRETLQAADTELQSAEAVAAATSEAVGTARTTRDEARNAVRAGQQANDQRAQHEQLLTRRQSAQEELDRAKAAMPAEKPQSPQAAQEAAADAKNMVRGIEKQLERREHVASEIQRVETWLRDEARPQLENEHRQAPLLAAAQEQLPQLEASLQAVSQDYAGAASAKQSAEKALSEGVCSECHRPFEDHDTNAAQARLDEAQAALQAQEQRLADARQAVDQRKAEIQRLAASFSVGWETSIQEHEQYLASLQEEWKTLQHVTGAQLDEAQDHARDLEQDYIAAHSAQQAYDSAARAVSEAQARLDAITADIEALGELPAAVDMGPLQDALDVATQALDTKVEEDSAARERANTAKRQSEDAARALRDAEATNEQIQADEKQLSLLNGFAKHLRDNRSKYLQQLWDGVMALASQFVAAATNNVVTGLSYHDGSFSFTENEVEAPVEAMSGGQKAIAGVALRLALDSRFFSKNSAVILDEPSAELNDEHASLMAGSLQGTGRQVLMITHRSAEEFAANNTLVIGEGV